MLHLYQFSEGSYTLLWSKPRPDQVDFECYNTISPDGSIIAISSDRYTDRLMFSGSLDRAHKQSVDRVPKESVDGVTESLGRVSAGLPGRPIAALDGNRSVVCKRSGEEGSVGISF